MSKVKTMSLFEFSRNRKEQYDCVVNEIVPVILQGKNVAITAPVKSGKRELVEIFAQFTKDSSDVPYVYHHYYICNLDRLDCKDQIEELESYGIVAKIGREINKDKESIINKVIESEALNHKVVFHIDESDYGTGNSQILNKLLKEVYKNPASVFIFYSATNEEVLHSEIKEHCVKVTFTPHESYKGCSWFIDNDLISNAEKFFENLNGLSLSNQAEKICHNHAQSDKFIGVVRLATRENKSDPDFSRFENDYNSNGTSRKELEQIYSQHGKNLHVIFVDAKRSLDWEPELLADGRYLINYSAVNKIKIDKNTESCLIFINQTSTRSTQWKIHKNLFFYHSFRENSCANTIMQADGRCIHYNTSGDVNDSIIKIYGNVEVFQYYADRIDANELKCKLATRIKQKKSRKNNGFYKMKILIQGQDSFDILPKSKRQRHEPIQYNGKIHNPQPVSKGGSRIRKSNSTYDGNMAKRIHQESGSQGFRDTILIDAPSPVYQDDWQIMLQKFPDIKEALSNNLKVYAIWELTSIKEAQAQTKKTSMYQNLNKSALAISIV